MTDADNELREMLFADRNPVMPMFAFDAVARKALGFRDERWRDMEFPGVSVGSENRTKRLLECATTMAGTFTVDQPGTGGTHVVWTAPLP